MNELLYAFRSASIRRSAFRVALVVGALLNIINQGGAIWNGGDIDWFHGLLNYLVPFLVSSYSAGKRGLEDEKHQERG
ncbi:MAG: nitrate/nitrite transporter NrtS [Steroidobacteraceae bacterium]|uniref:nitrate/nitrite transporter NrtS n=1 Tax=Alcaligenes sp. SMD-FA TaxID=2991054 RepID=UPI00222730BC|nr:nitrate/nitrite transporter NrtS [Alcaligenes sp. SMD-FA]UYY86325.1 nitrate/nitrite transporter NrtS [Alcaligenes sp. SMD-FA]